MIDALFLLRSESRGGIAKRAPHFAPKSLLHNHLLVIAATTPVKSAQFELFSAPIPRIGDHQHALTVR